MAFAQGSRTRLAFVPEVTFGTTPATPTLVALPIKTHSLDLTKDRLQGEDILGDRMPRVDRHGNRQARGSLEVDMRAGAFDPFLESAMFGAFATNILKVGTVPRFLTLEDAALDIAQFRVFRGMAVSSASFRVAPNQMVQTTFEMVGKSMTQGTATIATAVTPASVSAPFDSYNGALYDGGVSAGNIIGTVSSMSFSIQNALAPTFVVGSAESPQLEFGRAVVEGEMVIYYEDSTLINKFLNETESSIRLIVGAPGGGPTHTYDFPRVKYNGASAPLANPQSRMITIPFVSLFSVAAASNLVITRTA
jgi:hypothetical protein